MAKKVAVVEFQVEFDEDVTTAVKVAQCLQFMLETGLTTPGITDECGEIAFDNFEVTQESTPEAA